MNRLRTQSHDMSNALQFSITMGYHEMYHGMICRQYAWFVQDISGGFSIHKPYP
jgi:hypothetical protein